VAGGEVEADAGRELADAAGDLDQAQAQGVELNVGGRGAGEPAAEGVQEPEGGGVQDDAEGVGPEAAVAEAVGGERVLPVLYPVLGRAAGDVPVVERRRRVGTGGDDEAGVGALGERLGLEDDPPRAQPSAA
jgi:hypothetical protein